MAYPYTIMKKGMKFSMKKSTILSLKKKGMLVCFISKNDPKLTQIIFDNSNMILSDCDVIFSSLSWRPKYQRIKEISSMLNISLDQFVFMDNSLAEQNEMSLNLPEVYTLSLGKTLIDFPRKINLANI